MKLLALPILALALGGCDSMPQRGTAYMLPTYAPEPFYYRPIGRAQHQAPSQPLNCTSRWVGNTKYTDCY